MKKTFVLIGLLFQTLALSSFRYLVPGGENIGISLKADGVIVSNTYDVIDGKNIYNPKYNDIFTGDIIFEVNNYKVSNIKDFMDAFNKVKTNTTSVSLKRDGNIYKRQLKIIKSGNNYKTGLFIKERLLAIGTVSFYDPITKKYGALGHELKDYGSSKPFELKSGTIFESSVTGIKKSFDGKVGEKLATINEDNNLGDVLKNTEYGIYGSINDIPSNYTPLLMAEHDEVKLGKAKISTVVEGNKNELYDIEIVELKDQKEISTKGITFKITDARLINKTNGVISGMSGSPIIQNNMLVGAVTHVMVNEVSHGYGIYMEYMFEALNK